MRPGTGIDFRGDVEKADIPAFVVVAGKEAFLRREAIRGVRSSVLGDDDGEFSQSTFAGRDVRLRDVIDDLSTVVMFGPSRRLVLVELADDFVSRHRAELEDYSGRPKTTGVLVLEAPEWKSNTRLHKALDKSGLVIDCRPPTAAKLISWLVSWAKKRHHTKLPRDAASQMIELVGPEPGLLDQETAKLAAYAGADQPVTLELVDEIVGGWKTKTVWEMIDSMAAGNARAALDELERLIAAGQNPIALLNQMASPLRRFATATRCIETAEAGGRRMTLRAALERAGVRSFALAKAESQLRQLGRHRAARLNRDLLEADLALKGASTLPPRLVLERLIVQLARPRQQPVAASR